MSNLEAEEGIKQLEEASKTVGTGIRGMFNAIGNSTVTAATVIGLALIICTGMLITAGASTSSALERRHTANARFVEIQNNKSLGVVAAGAFAAITPIVAVDSISMKFKAVQNVTEYRIKWNSGSKQGLETFKGVVVDADGNVTLTMAQSVFGDSWSLDARIVCQVFASDTAGVTVSSKLIQVFVDPS